LGRLAANGRHGHESFDSQTETSRHRCQLWYEVGRGSISTSTVREIDLEVEGVLRLTLRESLQLHHSRNAGYHIGVLQDF
jgi:hypothetical protein